GKVKISLYEGTLGAPADAWDMVKNNAVQFTFTSDANNAGRMPILAMASLPLTYPSTKALWLTANEWLKAGYLKELTDNFKVIYFYGTSPLSLFLGNKKVVSANDLKGLKIRCGGAVQCQSVAALGASGVNMPFGELYMAIQTRMIDGAISGVDIMYDRKFYEVTKYVPKQPLYFGIYTLLMNKETWNDLPPELQKLIDQTAKEISTAEVDRRMREEQSSWDAYGKKTEVYSLSSAEVAKLSQALEGITDKYVKDASAKGYPAKEALELARKVVGRH
ncbi:MAG TPA: TRAP transporter substrate-binding protein DctP, partial [Syntrophorhabdaceae bacterium]|nr:TRAP transporter substrate-binding protein DctP [Syntrophorhabdaceae bacterium]